MSLIFCDSFDHYAAADMLKKWTSVGGTMVVGTTYGRFGGKGLYLNFGSSANYAKKVFPATYSTLYVGFGCYLPSLSSATPSFVLFQETNTTHVGVHLEDETGKIYVTRGATSLGKTPGQVISAGVWFHMQVKVYIHDSNGSVDVLINGVNVLSLSNVDTSNGGTSKINAIRLQGRDYIDDLWVDDAEYLGDCRIECLYPSAVGDTTEWTPSTGDNYACVDEVTPNSDTDYVFSETADQIDTYTFSDLVLSTGLIKGIQLSAYARKDDAGSRNIALISRPGSVNRIGASQAIADTYNYYREIWDLNPDTSLEWLLSEINAAKFGVKLVS
jgi:hypothetical protein